MGSKPHFHSVKAAIPKGEEGFWRIIQELDATGPFTVGDVDGRSLVNKGTVSEYCRRLRLGGYIAVVGERPHPLGTRFTGSPTYRISKAVELPPLLRRDGTPRPERRIDQIWRTVKMLRLFTASEIARDIELPPEKINTVRSYLHELHRVGILAVASVSKGRAGGGRDETTYRLARNLGAQAPRILAAKIVFDPNAGAVVGACETKDLSA